MHEPEKRLSPSISQDLEGIEALLTHGQWPRALSRLLDGVATANPHEPSDEVSALLLSVLDELTDDEDEQVQKLITAARRRHPAAAALYLYAGEWSIRCRRLVDAIRDFTKAHSMGLHHFRLYLMWGVSLLENGQRAPGETHLQTALQMAPDHAAHIHAFWGKALHEQGDDAAAMAHFTQALTHEPHDFYARAHVGVIHAKQSRLNEALVEYEEAIRTACLQDIETEQFVWIALEAVNCVTALQGNAAAADWLTTLLTQTEDAPALLCNRLRQLRALALGPGAKQWSMIVQGEEEGSEFYRECAVLADSASAALLFIKALHPPHLQPHLTVAQSSAEPIASGQWAGLLAMMPKVSME